MTILRCLTGRSGTSVSGIAANTRSLGHRREWCSQQKSVFQHDAAPAPAEEVSPDKQVLEARGTAGAAVPRGVFKATLLGQVATTPKQKVLKSGRTVTTFFVGTGGMFDSVQRTTTQWHRVTVYDQPLGNLTMKLLKAGNQVFVEGNLECRVFTRAESGRTIWLREIAVRQPGGVLFMGKDDEANSAAASQAGSGP